MVMFPDKKPVRIFIMPDEDCEIPVNTLQENLSGELYRECSCQLVHKLLCHHNEEYCKPDPANPSADHLHYHPQGRHTDTNPCWSWWGLTCKTACLIAKICTEFSGVDHLYYRPQGRNADTNPCWSWWGLTCETTCLITKICTKFLVLQIQSVFFPQCDWWLEISF